MWFSEENQADYSALINPTATYKYNGIQTETQVCDSAWNTADKKTVIYIHLTLASNFQNVMCSITCEQQNCNVTNQLQLHLCV